MSSPASTRPWARSARSAPARVATSTAALASSAPAVIVIAAWAVATGWVAALLIGRVEGLSAPPYDLAFFQQVVWSIGYGTPWTSSFHDGSFLGLHLSPALVVPAALERLVGPDVRVLSLLHAVAVGALVPAGFGFLRAVVRPARAADTLAAALAIPIPLWAATQDVIRSDFHPETFGVVAALLAGAAGLSGRLRIMWLLAGLALTTREDVAYAVGVVGLVVAVRGSTEARRHGRALVGVAVAWAVIAFGVVMPWLRDGAPSDTAHYYAWLGGGASVLVAPFTIPDRIVAAFTRPESWAVVGLMTASLAGLPLLRPRWAVLVVPPLIALLLSAHWPQAAIRFQYPLILVTPLLVAAAFGARRALALLGRRGPRLRQHALANVAMAVVVAMPALTLGAMRGSLPPFTDRDPAFQPRASMFDRARTIATLVPGDAPLLADEGLVAPVADRPIVGRLAAGPIPDDAYVLVDRSAWMPTVRIAGRHDVIVDGLSSSDRPVLVDDGRFVLWAPRPARGPS